MAEKAQNVGEDRPLKTPLGPGRSQLAFFREDHESN